MTKKLRVGVLLSGGLDSLLAVKIMQEQGAEIFALFFKLPFNKDTEKDLIDFSKKQKIHFESFDCTRGKFLKEYFESIKKAKYGRGAGFNPCIDCKIFIFTKAREFAERHKLDLIVSGEVLDERPMSQKKRGLDLVEKESGLSGILLRPLSAKLLKETFAEREKLVNRNSFFGIQGKRRIKQIELAKKYGLSYPNPAGGCLLCEKGLRARFKFFFAREDLWEYFSLWGVGRHFFIDENWVILGRNEAENTILEKVRGPLLIVPEGFGPSALVFGKVDKQKMEKINGLIKAYSKNGSLKERELFEKYKL